MKIFRFDSQTFTILNHLSQYKLSTHLPGMVAVTMFRLNSKETSVFDQIPSISVGTPNVFGEE